MQTQSADEPPQLDRFDEVAFALGKIKVLCDLAVLSPEVTDTTREHIDQEREAAERHLSKLSRTDRSVWRQNCGNVSSWAAAGQAAC